MALSNPETIEIRDESEDNERRFRLYIDGAPRAFVKRKQNGLVTMHLEVYGGLQWQEAKVMMQGLLQLSVIADQLSGPTA